MPALMQIATNLVLLFVVVMAIGTYTWYLAFSAWSQVGGADADLAMHLRGARRGAASSVSQRYLACSTLN